MLKSKKNHNGFYALHAIDNKVEDSGLEKRARKILETAATAAAASDIYLHELLRYDVNISNAIASVAKEQSITDIVMGLHRDKSPAIFLGKITGDLLGESNVTTYIYKPVQPLATIKRHIVIIPSQAEKEAGFLMWLHKIGNLARNTGTKIVVYAPETTLKYIEPLRRKQTATVETVLFKDWEKTAGPAARIAHGRLSVAGNEPPRTHLLPTGDEQDPGLPGSIPRAKQFRADLSRTGR